MDMHARELQIFWKEKTGKMNDILLSICVPTFNGASSIKTCVESILAARAGHEDEIEVIISDNGSEDNTFEIIDAIHENNYHVHRNEHNLGFKMNLCKLIDDYARGEFIWTIGDDDLISSHSIELFLKYYRNMDLMLLKNEMLSVEKNDALLRECNLSAKRCSYFEAVDSIASGGNILATFMSCAIFKRSVVSKIDKSLIQEDDWKSFSSIFPNGFLLYTGFSGSEKVYCVDDTFVYSLPIQRPWADMMIYIQTKVLPEFYLDICKKDYDVFKRLKRTRRIIIKALVKIALVYKDSRYKMIAMKSLMKIIMRR